MGSLPLAKASVGSAVNDATRTLGGALGVAVLGSLVSSGYRARHGRASPAPAQDSLAGALAVAGQAGGERARSSPRPRSTAFVDGMHAAVLVGAAIAVAGAVLALVALPARAAAAPRPRTSRSRWRHERARRDRDRARPPGRPRSERSHQAIVVATLELLAERGLPSSSRWSRSRAAPGVGKATIYRRWAAKADLVKDAIRYFSARAAGARHRRRWPATTPRSAARWSPRRATATRRCSCRGCSPRSRRTPRCTRCSRPGSSSRGARRCGPCCERAIERGELREDTDLELADRHARRAR